MLKIWGRLSSINVRKVVWTAHELGLDFERTDAGLNYGIVKSDAYRSLNPNARIPTIDDEGFVLWESNTIMRYLCAKHALGTLYPAHLQRRFDAERWMDWQQTTLNPAGREAFIQWLRTTEAQRQPAAIATSVAAMEPLLTLVDAHLARQPFMAGDQFTMADIPVACDVHRWFGLPQPRPAWPHLERWYAGLLNRPATRGVLDWPLA